MKKTEMVEVKQIKTEVFKVNIKGVSSLLYGRPTNKAIQNIKDKKAGKTIQKEKIQDIDTEVKESTYYMGDGNFGFPAAGFKSGMVDIADQIGLYKKDAKGLFKVLPEENGLITLKCKKHKVNERFIPRAGCIKYTTELIDWSASLNIMYDSSQISPDQIVNLLNRAGFHRGVGSFSPKNNGSFGMYEVRQ